MQLPREVEEKKKKKRAGIGRLIVGNFLIKQRPRSLLRSVYAEQRKLLGKLHGFRQRFFQIVAGRRGGCEPAKCTRHARSASSSRWELDLASGRIRRTLESKLAGQLKSKTRLSRSHVTSRSRGK